MQEGSARTHSEIAPPEGELPKLAPAQAGAVGEALRRAKLAGLGVSPSVAARQLPLGGSIWIGMLALWVRRSLPRSSAGHLQALFRAFLAAAVAVVALLAGLAEALGFEHRLLHLVGAGGVGVDRFDALGAALQDLLPGQRLLLV